MELKRRLSAVIVNMRAIVVSRAVRRQFACADVRRIASLRRPGMTTTVISDRACFDAVCTQADPRRSIQMSSGVACARGARSRW